MTRAMVSDLCEASSQLRSVFPQEGRPAALKLKLLQISAGFESSGAGVWFPLGDAVSYVLRIPADEAVLLNSREKAPYLVCIEVLEPPQPPGEEDGEESEASVSGGAGCGRGGGAHLSSAIDSAISRAVADGASTLVDVVITVNPDGEDVRVVIMPSTRAPGSPRREAS